MIERVLISSIIREGNKNKEGEIIRTILLDEQREIIIKVNEINIDENE